jgi:hypothetical protein
MTNSDRERLLTLIDELRAIVEAQDDLETITEIEFIPEGQDVSENAPGDDIECIGHHGEANSHQRAFVLEEFPSEEEVLDRLLLTATKKGVA